ncbi:MAG: hypothetical protein MK078_10310 [Crocinitomicaceae bacterium]|nr:hypothetical protein [Crocinitomicaceae bacterium]
MTKFKWKSLPPLVIRRDIYQLEKIAEDRLVITFRDKVQIEIEGAKLLDADCIALSGNKRFKLIIESRNINSNITGGALNYLAKEAPSRKLVIGSVLLVNNLPIRLLAKVYIRYHKPPYPSKIFKEREVAIRWLDELVPTITA